ncbi:MAG: hypothetical protein LBB88_01390 [Planctomycetaceae bacterium]|jgi:hypothetical protein|nr:hypothetical protein [Planctomycetaceae bacterium]
MKSRMIVLGLCVLGCFVISAVIYAQALSNNNQSLPTIEINAQFANADKNGDGSLSKEEFANYFAQIQQSKYVANNSAKETSQSGCCGGKNKAKDAIVESDEKTGGCCSSKAKTVDVKFSKDGEAKSSCCGGKDKTKDAIAKSDEKTEGCSGSNAKTVDVKFSKDGETKSSCCGGKDKAKDTIAKSDEKNCGCCGSKKTETANVKSSSKTEVKNELIPTTQKEVKTDSKSKATKTEDSESNNKQ